MYLKNTFTVVTFLCVIWLTTCQDVGKRQESLNANEYGNATSLDEEHVTEEAKPNTPSLTSLASQYTIYKMGKIFHSYYYPFVVVIGFLGNVLSLAVMLKRKNRKITCCVYMACLACTDNLCIFVAAYYWTVTDAPQPVGSRPMTT